MSTRSSSGSWSGAGGAPPDIIDLDKFMRGAVRPPRPDAHLLRCGDKLVVDAGGVDRKPAALGPGVERKPAALGPGAAAPAVAAGPPGPAPLSAASALSALTAPSAPSDSSGSRSRPRAPHAHGKHYSHDSGLSDTSYARRKYRPHRRAVGGDNTGVRAPRTPAPSSSHSLRAFRAVCERALLDQQAQIARVAQLCERLSERPPPPPLPPPRRRSDRSVTDSSDVSSSSRSTRDQRRKDKHRTDECKTYKIIMNKLDELNRLFATRARSPKPAPPAPPAPRAPPPRAPPAPASSGSVSVSDKLVSTEPLGAERTRDLHLASNVVTIRGGSTYGACGSCGAGGAGGAGGGGGARRLHPAPPAAALDALPRPNLVAERCAHGKNSVVLCESRAGTATGTSGCDPRCGFDLDDPVHLYSQAKRLQAMSATTRRARSVDPLAPRFQRYERFEYEEHSQRSQRSQRSGRAERREHSLCALCRGYWRSLTSYLAAQIFCCPDAAVR